MDLSSGIVSWRWAPADARLCRGLASGYDSGPEAKSSSKLTRTNLGEPGSNDETGTAGSVSGQGIVQEHPAPRPIDIADRQRHDLELRIDGPHPGHLVDVSLLRSVPAM
jgi:hypothetical protein